MYLERPHSKLAYHSFRPLSPSVTYRTLSIDDDNDDDDKDENGATGCVPTLSPFQWVVLVFHPLRQSICQRGRNERLCFNAYQTQTHTHIHTASQFINGSDPSWNGVLCKAALNSLAHPSCGSESFRAFPSKNGLVWFPFLPRFFFLYFFLVRPLTPSIHQAESISTDH